jgi:chromosomal replication initiation ATPase DnaA
VAEGWEAYFKRKSKGVKIFVTQESLGAPPFVRKVLRNLRRMEEKNIIRLTLKDLTKRVETWSNLSTTEITSGSKRPEIVRARAVLSYLAVRLNRMKTTEVADFLNVSQSAISKCLLSGETIVKENNGIISEILQ